MSALKTSYILLTYKQEATVAEAVNSVLHQDGPPIEIVITDDCSPDATFDVIEGIVAGYDGPHHVILNRNPDNLGLAGNIAQAHDLSSGDILIAAAGDDLSLPQRTQKIIEAFEAHQPLLVCSRAHVIDPDGAPLEGNFHSATFYHSRDPEKAARSKSLYLGATGAWHRDLYDKYGPLDPETYEDLVMGFRAALEGRVHVIEEPLVKYRLGQGITSSDLYYETVDAFRARRQKGFVANRAIMRQRIRDAETFGLTAGAPVLNILRREVGRAELGVSYYEDTAFGFLKRALRQPLYGLHTWYSEARRVRKMQRRIDARDEAGDG